jgi:thiol-disulfide isomerase/thioredoxin
MNSILKKKRISTIEQKRYIQKCEWNLFIATLLMLYSSQLFSQTGTLKVHLRGVSESKISIIPMNGIYALKPILVKDVIKNNEEASITIPASELPGEFVVRFDYKEKETSTPYPSEKQMILTEADVEIWVNPPYCNNSDSTWYQKNEKENTLYVNFTKENSLKKENIMLLQNFLSNYDDTKSSMYQQGLKDYEKRRNEYNSWLKNQVSENKKLFFSHLILFQYIPQLELKGNEKEKMESLITHYFDGIDFTDDLLMQTKGLKEFINSYVNIYGSISFTEKLKDSLFTLCGQRAIEKASLGSPRMYGWMVDYFYTGYETYNIKPGMLMLETHINNPNCLTTKKLEIIKRLNGIEKLTVGTLSPNFILQDSENTPFNFHEYKSQKQYKLLLFWSADCSHCMELVEELTKWMTNNGNKIEIIAVSLDETDTELIAWNTMKKNLIGWKHLNPIGGITSKVANDYSILSTPSMFLIDSIENKIQFLPKSISELNDFLRVD